MNPEICFVISTENRQKIKDLLKKLQKEKQLDENASSIDTQADANILHEGKRKVIGIITNILYEALQFVNIIPNQTIQELSVEIDELK